MSEDILEPATLLGKVCSSREEVVEVDRAKSINIEVWNSYSVQSFGSYRVGNPIEFWHHGDHCWIEGKIAYIKLINNFFLCLYIKYKRWKKDYQEIIYREDWLNKALRSSIKRDIFIVSSLRY